jgi:hypothetical protein
LTIDSGAETNIDMGMTTRRTKNPKEQSCTHYFNSKWAIVMHFLMYIKYRLNKKIWNWMEQLKWQKVFYFL